MTTSKRSALGRGLGAPPTAVTAAAPVAAPAAAPTVAATPAVTAPAPAPVSTPAAGSRRSYTGAKRALMRFSRPSRTPR